jgi:hypothetical protein
LSLARRIYMQERFHMLNKSVVKSIFMATALLIATAAGAQEQSQKSHDQGGMAGMDMGDAQKQAASPEARAANDAMSGNMSDHDMDMSAHMFMTDLRPANAVDEKRAAEILTELRPAIEKYRDYKVALAEGFQIFLPNVPRDTITSRTIDTRSKPDLASIRSTRRHCYIKR